MGIRTVALAVLVVASTLVAAAASPAPMNNADVIKLVGMDLGDDLVISAIRRAPNVDFRLDTEGLTQLTGAKVSREVIRAMFARTEPAPAPAAAPAAPVPPPAPAGATGSCEASLVSSGSMFGGRTSTVFVDTPESDPERVVARLETYLVAKKNRISGKKPGEIWVENKGDTDELPSSTLGFRVRRTGTGTRVEARYEMSPATFVHYDVTAMLCGILEGAIR